MKCLPTLAGFVDEKADAWKIHIFMICACLSFTYPRQPPKTPYHPYPAGRNHPTDPAVAVTARKYLRPQLLAKGKVPPRSGAKTSTPSLRAKVVWQMVQPEDLARTAHRSMGVFEEEGHCFLFCGWQMFGRAIIHLL